MTNVYLLCSGLGCHVPLLPEIRVQLFVSTRLLGNVQILLYDEVSCTLISRIATTVVDNIFITLFIEGCYKKLSCISVLLSSIDVFFYYFSCSTKVISSVSITTALFV